jgi:hypothetical protein
MTQNESDVLILKPTPVFMSFLASQLPDLEFLDIGPMPTDYTAYTLPKHESDEETLDEIERHFPMMFKHEIHRILGDRIQHEIEGTFLDFLCCFKFELHSQIVVMEPTIDEGHQLVCVKPRSVLLKWMKSAFNDQIDLTSVLAKMDVSHLAKNATVLVKNFKHPSDLKPFIKDFYRPIFKAEMLRMCDNAEQWPEVDSFQTFSRYFAVEMHTQLIHLH